MLVYQRVPLDSNEPPLSSAKTLSARREGATILAQRAQPHWRTYGAQAGALDDSSGMGFSLDVPWVSSQDHHGIFMGL